eukprot:scaffold25996_cov20-Tisochrysis_lutea.AAC.4
MTAASLSYFSVGTTGKFSTTAGENRCEKRRVRALTAQGRCMGAPTSSCCYRTRRAVAPPLAAGCKILLKDH